MFELTANDDHTETTNSEMGTTEMNMDTTSDHGNGGDGSKMPSPMPSTMQTSLPTTMHHSTMAGSSVPTKSPSNNGNNGGSGSNSSANDSDLNETDWILIVIAVGVGCILIGFAIGWFVGRRSKSQNGDSNFKLLTDEDFQNSRL